MPLTMLLTMKTTLLYYKINSKSKLCMLSCYVSVMGGGGRLSCPCKHGEREAGCKRGGDRWMMRGEGCRAGGGGLGEGKGREGCRAGGGEVG